MKLKGAFFVAADCCEPYNQIKEREGVVLQKRRRLFCFSEKGAES